MKAEQLDAIQARADESLPLCVHGCVSPLCETERDRHDLLSLIRVQAAKLDAILALANANGRAGWLVTPTEIRETLGVSA